MILFHTETRLLKHLQWNSIFFNVISCILLLSIPICCCAMIFICAQLMYSVSSYTSWSQMPIGRHRRVLHVIYFMQAKTVNYFFAPWGFVNLVKKCQISHRNLANISTLPGFSILLRLQYQMKLIACIKKVKTNILSSNEILNVPYLSMDILVMVRTLFTCALLGQ